MNRRILFVLFGFITISMNLIAQGLTIKELKEVPSGADAFHAPFDENGSPCGLLKVRTMVRDLKFEGNVYGDVRNENNEYYVFLAKGSNNIVIKRSGIMPLIIKFSDYGIDEISSKATYQMVLKEVSLHPKKNKVVIDVRPFQADVFINEYHIDNDNDGLYQLFLPKGDYIIKAEQNGYRPKVVVVKSGKEENNISLELESVLAELEVNCQTTTADIYIEGEFKGKGHWKGLMPPGSYTVEVSLNDYVTQKKDVTLSEKDNKNILFNKLVRSKSSLVIHSNPSPCDVYIDGVFKGASTTPIIELTTGEHNAEFRQQFGYKPIQRIVTIKSDEDNTISLDFEPLDDTYKHAFKGNLDCIIQLAEKHRNGANYDIRTVNMNADSVQADYWYKKAFDIVQKKDDNTFLKYYNALESYYSTQSSNFSFTEALYLYQRYAKVSRNDMCLSLSECYVKIEDWDNAIMYLKKYLDNTENCNETLFAYLAVLYKKKGDYEKALEWYYKAKEESLKEKRSYLSTSDHAYQVYIITTYGMEIADVYLKKGDVLKAVEMYRQLKGRFVGDPAGKKLKELGY